MKMRPTFEFFPAAMFADPKDEASKLYVANVRITFETGGEMSLLMFTDKAEQGGFMESDDLSALLANMSAAVKKFGDQVKTMEAAQEMSPEDKELLEKATASQSIN